MFLDIYLLGVAIPQDAIVSTGGMIFQPFPRFSVFRWTDDDNNNLTIRLLKTNLNKQKPRMLQGALKKRGALPGFHSPTACQRLYMATQLAIERNAKVLHAAGHGAVSTRSQNLLAFLWKKRSFPGEICWFLRGRVLKE